MKAVIQRVKSCSVSIEGQVVSEIGTGLFVLLGVARGDGPSELAFLSDKVLNLRIFPDSERKMNLSVLEINGELMVVSQFTLLADCRKGRRPSFVDAADPAIAEPLYEEYVSRLAASGLKVATGAFGAMMDVRLENWGPVTLIIDSPQRDKV
jgi:D-tyrosyl-tRNA(Tyr) deacylase